jgi:hypothetical protein
MSMSAITVMVTVTQVEVWMASNSERICNMATYPSSRIGNERGRVNQRNGARRVKVRPDRLVIPELT